MRVNENAKAILPNGITEKKCPYCNKEIINRTPADYSKDEKHPCEYCGGLILWAPMWSFSDLRD